MGKTAAATHTCKSIILTNFPTLCILSCSFSLILIKIINYTMLFKFLAMQHI